MDNFITVFIACASKKEARNIVNLLLKERLIACANIIPGVESHFWWDGRINTAKEFLILAKTAKKKFCAVERAVKRTHSYDVPEIVALPLTAGSKSYLKWVREETS